MDEMDKTPLAPRTFVRLSQELGKSDSWVGGKWS
jgi:hypothetical protein